VCVCVVHTAEEVRWLIDLSLSVLHVMQNPSVNNETLSQLDVHSTENIHISLLQIL